MQFTRVVSPVEDMEIWNASSDGFSFVISSGLSPGISFCHKEEPAGREPAPSPRIVQTSARAS
jgi:hypothetical protein